jgi:hypothetical protein
MGILHVMHARIVRRVNIAVQVGHVEFVLVRRRLHLIQSHLQQRILPPLINAKLLLRKAVAVRDLQNQMDSVGSTEVSRNKITCSLKLN